MGLKLGWFRLRDYGNKHIISIMLSKDKGFQTVFNSFSFNEEEN